MTARFATVRAFVTTTALLSAAPALAEETKGADPTLDVCVDAEADLVRAADGGCLAGEQKTTVAALPLGDAVVALQSGYGLSLSDLTATGQWVSPKLVCDAGEVLVETPAGVACLPPHAPVAQAAPGSLWLLPRYARMVNAVPGNDRRWFTQMVALNPGDGPMTGSCLFLGWDGGVLYRTTISAGAMGSAACFPYGIDLTRITSALMITDRPVFAHAQTTLTVNGALEPSEAPAVEMLPVDCRDPRGVEGVCARAAAR
ncbi:hypothetical protein L6V77_16110 [Myxococcota bacterium]|nr:hypothetical protein [Myxococcota bacterium]